MCEGLLLRGGVVHAGRVVVARGGLGDDRVQLVGELGEGTAGLVHDVLDLVRDLGGATLRSPGGLDGTHDERDGTDQDQPGEDQDADLGAAQREGDQDTDQQDGRHHHEQREEPADRVLVVTPRLHGGDVLCGTLTGHRSSKRSYATSRKRLVTSRIGS